MPPPPLQWPESAGPSGFRPFLAVLHGTGRSTAGQSVPVQAKLEGTELTFALQFAEIGARTFDFAVATLRQEADVAPDRGVFIFRPASRHVPAQRELTHRTSRRMLRTSVCLTSARRRADTPRATSSGRRDRDERS